MPENVHELIFSQPQNRFSLCRNMVFLFYKMFTSKYLCVPTLCHGLTGINKNKKKEREPTPVWETQPVVWSQAHIVSIDPGQHNFTSSPRWNPLQHHGKPCEGGGRVEWWWGWVLSRGCDRNTASSKFSGIAVSSGLISIFSNSLSFPSLTITAKTLHLLRRLTGRYSTGGPGLNRRAEPAGRPRPIRGRQQAYPAWARASRRHILVQKLHYRKDVM